MNSNLINAAFQIFKSVKLSAYAYLLDYCNQNDFGSTTNTFGFRISGSREIHKSWKILYDAEYARQADGGNNPNSVEENYYRLEGGVSKGNFLTFKAGHEVLGGSPGTGPGSIKPEDSGNRQNVMVRLHHYFCA